MKMIYGGVPYNTLKLKHFEVDTNICDMEPSDLQAGKTGVVKGKIITGTGKSFEFARYGDYTTNRTKYVPTNINIIQVSSAEHPIKVNMALLSMKDVDFTKEQNIATIIIDGVEYDLFVSVQSNIMKITCDQTVQLQVFYGKDNYI